MTQDQALELIPLELLLDKVQALRGSGYRLVQIGANRFPDRVELTYSFDLNGRLTSLRVQLPSTEPRAPSISSIFGCAVLYENEIHDLFNVRVENIALDFHGHLYETAVKFPFGAVKAPAAPKSPAPPPTRAGSTPGPANQS